jgi:hypothetical protein
VKTVVLTEVPVYFPVYREFCNGDRFAYDCAHHHPVLGFGPSQAISHFVRGNRGFLASGASLNSSPLAAGRAFAGLSPLRKFPFPRVGGDRFDDWVVGHQSEPYCLHHPLQTAYFRQDAK